jgi:hypothetical protein
MLISPSMLPAHHIANLCGMTLLLVVGASKALVCMISGDLFCTKRLHPLKNT